jgi:pre-mRNA-splicing factor SYF1
LRVIGFKKKCVFFYLTEKMNAVLEDTRCNSICIDSNRYHYELIDWTKIDSFMHPRKMASSILHTCDATLPNIFEFEFQRNPFRVKLWISYLDCNKCSPKKDRFMMYERALAVLPRSYKLWYRYLQERIAGVVGEPPISDSFQEINCLFERCLVYLTLMPVIWLQYLDFLRLQPYVTKTRRCYNRALQTLPVTQHKEIWESYCDFVKRVKLPLLSTIVYHRYLMYDSSQIGEYVELLKQVNQIDKAAMILVETLSQDIVSVKGKTAHQLW